MTEGESFLRQFHARYPGITSRVFARSGSYDRLAACVPARARVLDLGCGDGALLGRLGPEAVGVDLSVDELAASSPAIARGRAVQGRAQALPFATAAFDAVACHLAFMLLDDVEQVVAELARVLVPGGTFLAVLGGGPTAGPDDAFHRFLALLARAPRRAPRFGDPRARTEAGWRQLFAGWEVHPFERWELDLSGSFDEVWAFLAASYELPAEDAPALRAELLGITTDLVAGGTLPCRVVTWLARAVRPRCYNGRTEG